MVGKRDGNEARARQPTPDAAKSNAVSYGMSGSGCCENDWLVSIGAAQRIQPCWRMKNRRARMCLQELFPTVVLNRINAVDFHYCCGFSSRCFLPARSEQGPTEILSQIARSSILTPPAALAL